MAILSTFVIPATQDIHVTRKIFRPDIDPRPVGRPLADAEALFKKKPVQAYKRPIDAEKDLFAEGSMESRLASRARHATRLMQSVETLLKGKASTPEERELLREISALLDYVEFGEKT